MKIKLLGIIECGLLFIAAVPVHAGEVPSAQYLCMEPASITADPGLSDAKGLPPIKSQPTEQSPTIGIGTRIVFVRRDSQRNGYLEATLFNGKSGWVEAASVQPYHNLRHPEKTCSVVGTGGGKLTYRLH